MVVEMVISFYKLVAKNKKKSLVYINIIIL